MTDRNLPERQGPLDGYAEDFAAASSNPHLFLRAVDDLIQIGLRADIGDKTVFERIQAIIGVALQLTPCSVSVSPRSQARILWLEPGYWLIVAERSKAPTLMEELGTALAGTATSLVDLSSSRAVLAIAGRDASALLNKLCPLDLREGSLAPFQVVGSTLARTQIHLEQLDTPSGSSAPRYFLYIRASFAAYAAEALLDALPERDLAS